MALTNDDLMAIGTLLTPINERLDEIDSRFDKVDSRLDKVDSRLNKMDSRFDKVDSRLDVIELKQNLTTKKLDDLHLDVRISNRNIRRDIHKLNDEMETVIEILRQHTLLPT